MKPVTSLAYALTALALTAVPARATTYTDSVGDTFTGAGGGILDITSVEVHNDATDIFFTINLNGPIGSPNDWGNYMIGIDSVAGGDTSSPVGNPWARPIQMSSGMDYWLGSWVNGGGGMQVWHYTGSWTGPASSGVTLGTSSVTLTTSLASLGLSAGNTFAFDVYASGADGNPGAIDALANPNQTVNDWGVAYDSGALVDTYLVTPVPEPAACVLLGLGGLLVLQRSLRRRA